MARPTRNNVEYFPHFTNARNGKTLKIIQRMFGNDGYAAFFKILEILGETEGHYYDYREFDDWIFLVAELGVSEERAEKILSFLSKSKTIDPELAEQKVIWSDNFVDGLSPVYAKRKRLLPQKPSFCAGNLIVEPVTATESTQRKGKERKGKERKKHIPDSDESESLSERSDGMDLDRPSAHGSQLDESRNDVVDYSSWKKDGQVTGSAEIKPLYSQYAFVNDLRSRAQVESPRGTNQQNSTGEGRVRDGRKRQVEGRGDESKCGDGPGDQRSSRGEIHGDCKRQDQGDERLPDKLDDGRGQRLGGGLQSSQKREGCDNAMGTNPWQDPIVPGSTGGRQDQDDVAGDKITKGDGSAPDAASEGNSHQDGGRQTRRAGKGDEEYCESGVGSTELRHCDAGGENLLPENGKQGNKIGDCRDGGVAEPPGRHDKRPDGKDNQTPGTFRQPSDRVDGCDQRVGGASGRPREAGEMAARGDSGAAGGFVPGQETVFGDLRRGGGRGKEADRGEVGKGNTEPDKPAPKYRTKKNRWLTGQRLSDFEEFWQAFHAHGAKKNGKAPSADSWLDIKDYTPELVKWIIFAAGRYADERQDILQRNGTPKWAQGWLTDRRWEDYPMEEERPKKAPRTKEQIKAEIYAMYGRKNGTDLQATTSCPDGQNAPTGTKPQAPIPAGTPLEILFGK